LGIITPSGEVADSQRLEPAVLARRSHLQKVGQALAAGGRSVILRALDNAAAPVILNLIDKLVR